MPVWAGKLRGRTPKSKRAAEKARGVFENGALRSFGRIVRALHGQVPSRAQVKRSRKTGKRRGRNIRTGLEKGPPNALFQVAPVR